MYLSIKSIKSINSIKSIKYIKLQRIEWFLLIRLIDSPQTPTICGLGSQRCSVEIQIFLAPSAQSKYLENRSISQLEHGSSRTGAHLSWRNGAHLSWRLEHGSPRTGAHLSWRTGAHLSWSTALREPEHISVLRFMHPCIMHWWFKPHLLAVTVWSKSQKNIGGKGAVKRHDFNNFCPKWLFLGPKNGNLGDWSRILRPLL